MSARTGSNRGSEQVAVRFEFNDPTAQRVCFAGSFNGWDPSAVPMVAAGQGRWVADLRLPPGPWEYLLVVDGQWLFDPNAKDYMPNVFGGMNAVIDVPPARAWSGAMLQPPQGPRQEEFCPLNDY